MDLSEDLFSYIQLFTWERSIADACRVSFDHADNLADGLRWDSESRKHAADRAVAARHVRISSEVDVQHGSVGAFDEDGFTVAQRRVEIKDCVFDVRTQLLGVFSVTREFDIEVDLAAGEQSLMC